MSHLSVYQPELDELTDEPVILSFEGYFQPHTLRFEDALLQRARLMKSHQSCPHCQSAHVLPVETFQRKGSTSFRSMGTSAMTAEFACQTCHWSWKAR